MQARPETLPYRFPFRHAGADQAFRDWVLADARAARLSLAFRAYYHVRALVPVQLRQLLQRCRPVQATERWWFPDEFIGRLTDIFANDSDTPIIHPWPDGADFGLVLTHDVETADGLAKVAPIADMEQELGFRSSWNVVPYKYDVDHGLLRELQARGFEIGVHGYNHDGTLYLSKSIFERRVPGINAALRSFGAVGFRSPMVHRNLAWLQMLDIEYDASCFDVDPYQAMPGGVGSIWPLVAGKFVELPYTLPQDHTVFIALGAEDGAIWQQKLDYLARRSGMALMLTHPDYLDGSRRLDVYREFLQYAREKGPTSLCAGLPTPHKDVGDLRPDSGHGRETAHKEAREKGGWWHALPREVAAWWREREQSTIEQDSHGTWRVRGPASDRAAVAQVNVGDGQLHIERLAACRPTAAI